MKKGFTLSEVLITLVIIGVVAAMTIPVLNNIRPDKDKSMYQKALYSIQGAMTIAMQDPMASISSAGWADSNVSNTGFCDVIADALNTSGQVNCGASSYDSPNFTTVDGIKFWGFEGKTFGSTDSRGKKYRTVYVDRELSSKEKSTLSKKRDASHTTPGLKILIYANGKVKTGSSADWNYENSFTKKFVNNMNE